MCIINFHKISYILVPDIIKFLYKSSVVEPVFFFLIQFNVPFKIISLIETSQSIGGAKREYPGKTT